ncbi:MAG: lipoprotein [Treponema sp.]
MKKYKIGLHLLPLCAAAAVFFGCKTPPSARRDVDALSLLDGKSAFYLKAPADADRDLIVRMIFSGVKGVSQKDAEQIAARVDTVYAGINRTAKKTEFQIAASCNVPKAFLPYVFSAKNGWSARRVSFPQKDCAGGADSMYAVFNNGAIDAAFPSEKIACIGRGVDDMLDTFDSLAFACYNLKNTDKTEKTALDAETRLWLSGGDNDILFAALSPQSFLTLLTGANLNFKLAYVRGRMENDPKNASQYVMDLEFEFLDRKFIPLAKGALSLAFGLTDSNVILETPTHLKVTSIKIDKKSLYEILVL